MLRELGLKSDPPPIYGGPLPMAMARSKLDEHRMRDIELEDVADGETIEAGPFDIELVHMTHSIPDSNAVALDDRARDGADHRRLQVRPDARRRPPGRHVAPRRARARGLLLLCGDSTNADRAGFSPSEAGVGPHLEEAFARCEGRIVVTSFASNIHRVQQVVDAAAALGRKVALVGRSMRKNVEHRAHRSATSTCPRGCWSSRARSTTSPTTSS